MSPRHKGYYFEEKIKEHFLKKSFKFLHQNLKTPFAEIDLVFRGPDKRIYLIEVKKVRNEESPLSPKQVQRLVRAQFFIQEKWQCEVRVWLVTVDGGEGVTIIQDVLPDLV